MKIREDQILDIKCILADVKKKDIARDLNIDPVALSRNISNQLLKDQINKYFENINPEINAICNKLQFGDVNLSGLIEEPRIGYNETPKAEIDRLRLDLARERKTVDLLQRFNEKLEDENREYLDELLIYRAGNKQKPTG